MAEYTVVPARALRPKPVRLSWDEAAAYPVAYLTAYVALVRCARLEPGEWLLVFGAAGGVGLASVDLAQDLGARDLEAARHPGRWVARRARVEWVIYLI